MSRSLIVEHRVDTYGPSAMGALQLVYGDQASAVAQRAMAIVTAAASERVQRLWDRDLERDPHWFCDPNTIGYVCYVDRFSETLAGVSDHIGYLEELGVTYLHLMPILKSRPGESDGGYAVMSYDAVDPSIGSIDDLPALAESLHDHSISLCIDLVLNHTAKEHEWAVRAVAGDDKYRAYYRIFPDRELPDLYEQTLREIFPDFAPGSFSPVGDEWIWTTFNEFQWDLNYENPDVFCEMLTIMCRLANLGVDVFRLDAVPFLWKRLGTDCENQPEAHQILTAFRSCMSVVSPTLVFKAEAIVSPELLAPYLGAGDPPRHECDIAYNNQLMVLLWSSLATREAGLMSNALARMNEQPPGTAWVTYARCHDDIGWAITDDTARSVGWDGASHRKFLSDFYSSSFDDTFAIGELFQHNPQTGDSRISGSAASLCGIERAILDGDGEALDRAIARLELVYAVIYCFGGIPLVYMGDELGLVNDLSYLDDPKFAADNRWMHRPKMNWTLAAKRLEPSGLTRRLFTIFAELGRQRRLIAALNATVETKIWDSPNSAILNFSRVIGELDVFAMLANFGEEVVQIDNPPWLDRLTAVRSSAGVRVEAKCVVIPPLGYAWFA